MVIFYVATRGHHADIGGTVQGSAPANSIHKKEEGDQIDNFKIVSIGLFLEDEIHDLLSQSEYPARNIDQNIVDLKAQVAANKRIATLAFENAKMEQRKEEGAEDVKLSDGGKLPTQTPRELPSQASDPKAESWAAKNDWFGQDRAMTFTAFEIHKDLVEKEGYDPKSDEYYAEVDKRIRVDFPHKFGKTENIQTTKPVQSVASVNRSVKSGRKTVKLTPSQVAIAKKLGVPLEEYAKQLKLTKEV